MNSNTKGGNSPRKTKWSKKPRKACDDVVIENDEDEETRLETLIKDLDKELRDRGLVNANEEATEELLITEAALVDDDDDEYVLEDNEIIDEIEMTASNESAEEDGEVVIEEIDSETMGGFEVNGTGKDENEGEREAEADNGAVGEEESMAKTEEAVANSTDKSYSQVFKKNIGALACIGGIFVAFTLYFTYNNIPFRMNFGDQLPTKHPEL